MPKPETPTKQIVNKTMGAAIVHLYHFIFIFGVIFMGHPTP